jgi:hypothetical protein
MGVSCFEGRPAPGRLPPCCLLILRCLYRYNVAAVDFVVGFVYGDDVAVDAHYGVPVLVFGFDFVVGFNFACHFSVSFIGWL